MIHTYRVEYMHEDEYTGLRRPRHVNVRAHSAKDALVHFGVVAKRSQYPMTVLTLSPVEDELFRLVEAWQAQERVCREVYERTSLAIKAALDAVGGYATTSPTYEDAAGVPYESGKGYCRSFSRHDAEGWSEGAETAGDRYGGTGPYADTVAPHHPEVGDRCLVLANECRTEALATGAARAAVRAYIERVGGGTEPEDVALTLYKEIHG